MFGRRAIGCDRPKTWIFGTVNTNFISASICFALTKILIEGHSLVRTTKLIRGDVGLVVSVLAFIYMWFKFESCWSLRILVKIVFEKDEMKQKS